MEKLCRSSTVRRLLLPGICIILTLVLCKDPVLADANYKIKLNAAVENAVFTLSYTGEVDGLTIISPAGVSYDSSTCGTAYQKESGKIRIGVLYADPGSWQIIIIGAPDDGFRLLIISDKEYGEYAGTLASDEPNPALSETAMPSATTGPTELSASGTESAVTGTVPKQSDSSPVLSNVKTESETNSGTVVTMVTVPGKEISGEAYEDETVSGMLTTGSSSPAPVEYSETTTPEADFLSESGTACGTVQKSITDTAPPVLAVDNGGTSQKPLPVPDAEPERTGDRDGMVLFAAATVTLSVIVITVGKILRSTVGTSSPIRPNKKETAKIDYRDYFPEEK